MVVALKFRPCQIFRLLESAGRLVPIHVGAIDSSSQAVALYSDCADHDFAICHLDRAAGGARNALYQPSPFTLHESTLLYML